MSQFDLNLINNELSTEKIKDLINVVKSRFYQYPKRHVGLEWKDVEFKLEDDTDKIRSLYAMEITNGEPDIIFNKNMEDQFYFVDCAAESPSGRRNICYDLQGQQLREKKGIFPAGNAIDIATAMKIELLSEEQYQLLQKYGNFDTKTSSWLQTNSKIRKLGGAIFGDNRYNTVFIYHNSAHSFYSVRSFRGILKL
ncbi:MAG: DUF4256 domain-containing protein [Candidatus Heimdallarchaeota archaeon]|nr:DUF4256 domain-containing protein [Candidatus Heimdallarchaeota archaeon]